MYASQTGSPTVEGKVPIALEESRVFGGETTTSRRRRKMRMKSLVVFLWPFALPHCVHGFQRELRHRVADAVPAVRLAADKDASLTSFETAMRQYQRLLAPLPPDFMPRSQRIVRILFSWLFLLSAKSLALLSPLYFRSLIDHGAAADKELLAVRSVSAAMQSSALGLVLGVGAMKLAAGLVQFVGELLLSPVTSSTAAVLPAQAFASALRAASMRQDDAVALPAGLPAGLSTPPGKPASAAAEEKTGLARRALDRGLRASDLLLYRSIFNLLPALVESGCVLALLCRSTNAAVGATAAMVTLSFVLFTSLIMNYRLKFIRLQLAKENVANGCVEDALSLAETVAAFGALHVEERRYSAALRSVCDAATDVRRSFSVLKLIQAAILSAGSAAMMYAAWMSHALSSTHSIAGTLVLTQALFAQMCAPLDHIGQHFRDCAAAAEDLRDLESIKHRPASSAVGRDLFADPARSGVDALPVAGDARLELRNLSFSYLPQESPSFLKNIQLRIPHGGYALGVVGPSGSGKSTLLRVLLGTETTDARQVKGQILVNGRDVTDCQRVPFFSVVSQDNDLFRGLTLRENIQYGALTAPQSGPFAQDAQLKALRCAADDAQLHGVLAQQPLGWDMAVGPRGRLLSGGERQRVCIARALYRQQLSNAILLMDEVTASLDVQTESLITSALMRRVRSGATAVIVAHRLASVQHCDHIIVLRNGEVAESGSHSKLMKSNGWYAEAWRLQSEQTQLKSTTDELLRREMGLNYDHDPSPSPSQSTP